MAVTIDGTTGITNDGGYTGDGVVFADTTPANTLVTTTGGNVVIGATQAYVADGDTQKFQVQGLTQASASASLTNWSASASSEPNLVLAHSCSGAIGTHTASVANDNLGNIVFCGSDGSVFNAGVAILAEAEGTWSGSSTPARVAFFTVPSGSTSGVERARIDSSGNLLVGVSSWSDGGGGSFIANRTASNINGKFSCSSTSSQVIFYFTNPNGVVGLISASGSTTSYVTSSDYRLKNTIAPMTGAIAKVAALKPVTYKWNADGSDGQGFIAHELQAVVPEAVVGEKDAVDADGNPQYQGIDTSFLVATLTAAIQEQQAIITALTARVAALEGK